MYNSWRRQWHPTPVLLPGKSHGWRSLVGCSPWGHEESDMTEHFTFTFHFHALEKEMATHSSVLAWRIPGMAEPGGLPSLGSHRVGHDWSNLAAAAVAVYICQCYSLTLSHPLLLLCLQVHFLHLHLYLCPANRFIRTIFLDFIYMCEYTLFFFLFLSYFTLYNRLYVHPPQFKSLTFVPFYGWIIFHCVYVPQLFYPFICWWIFRLFPCLDYCK